MHGNRWARVAVLIAVVAVTLAALIPRQEIGHTEPAIGQVSEVLYDYLIVTRVTVLLVGLAVAGILLFVGRRKPGGRSR